MPGPQSLPWVTPGQGKSVRETVSGFRVASAAPGRKPALTGRHRYRRPVSGTGGHVIGMRQPLSAIDCSPTAG